MCEVVFCVVLVVCGLVVLLMVVFDLNEFDVVVVVFVDVDVCIDDVVWCGVCVVLFVVNVLVVLVIVCYLCVCFGVVW